MLSALLAAAVFAAAVAFPLFARFNVDAKVVARMNESAVTHGAAQAPLPSAEQWFIDLVPSNVFKAAADGALLPLIVFSVAFGLALTGVERQRRATLVPFFQGIAEVFLVLVEYVVKFAPIGVFALAVPLAAHMGAAAAGALAYYMAILSAINVAFHRTNFVSSRRAVRPGIALEFREGCGARAGDCLHFSLFAGCAPGRL